MTTRKRIPVPPVDELIPTRQQQEHRKDVARSGVEIVKTTAYLTPDQVDGLDELRQQLRKQGYRLTTSAGLVRAAVRLASRHPDEWVQSALEEVG